MKREFVLGLTVGMKDELFQDQNSRNAIRAGF